MMKALRHLLTGFLLLICASLAAQEGRVHGFVYDPDGRPLEFTNVALKGTTIGTSTSETAHMILKSRQERKWS